MARPLSLSPPVSPIGPDRTQPTATHAGTAHALFTGWLFLSSLLMKCRKREGIENRLKKMETQQMTIDRQFYMNIKNIDWFVY